MPSACGFIEDRPRRALARLCVERVAAHGVDAERLGEPEIARAADALDRPPVAEAFVPRGLRGLEVLNEGRVVDRPSGERGEREDGQHGEECERSECGHGRSLPVIGDGVSGTLCVTLSV